MAVLSRDQILEADDLHTERVPVPEWGGDILIRGLSGAERDRFEAAIVRMQGSRATPSLDNIRARLVAMAAVDEEGNRIFGPADVVKLGAKSGAVLDRLFDVARRLSGMTEADVQAITEDFGGAQSGDSGSI